MSGFMIEDGMGEGFKAKVDASNRLVVLSQVDDLSSVSLQHGRAFISYIKRDTTGTGNEAIGAFQYNGSHHAHIKKLIMSTTSSNGKFEFFIDPTSYSGGTSVTPFNLNRMSNVSSDMAVISGLTDITYSVASANEMWGVRLNIGSGGTSAFVYDLEGSLILGPGDAFLIQGSTTNAGEKLRCAVYWYEATGEMGM